jgi:protein TonB
MYNKILRTTWLPRLRGRSLLASVFSGVVLLAFFQTTPTAWGRTLSIGTDSSAVFTPAQPTYSPEPEIPAHLQEECFCSYCIAKFSIKPSGASSVQLLTSSGSAEVDELALATLRRWKFKPATMDGAPVEGTKKIKVEFKIE